MFQTDFHYLSIPRKSANWDHHPKQDEHSLIGDSNPTSHIVSWDHPLNMVGWFMSVLSHQYPIVYPYHGNPTIYMSHSIIFFVHDYTAILHSHFIMRYTICIHLPLFFVYTPSNQYIPWDFSLANPEPPGETRNVSTRGDRASIKVLQGSPSQVAQELF